MIKPFKRVLDYFKEEDKNIKIVITRKPPKEQDAQFGGIKYNVNVGNTKFEFTAYDGSTDTENILIRSIGYYIDKGQYAKGGGIEGNSLYLELSNIDHTRVIKWMNNQFDNERIDIKKSGSGYIIDTSKLSKTEVEDLMYYLKQQDYISKFAKGSTVKNGKVDNELKFGTVVEFLQPYTQFVMQHTDESNKERNVRGKVLRIVKVNEYTTPEHNTFYLKDTIHNPTRDEKFVYVIGCDKLKLLIKNKQVRIATDKYAKGGYVFKGDKYEYVPTKFEYTIGGL